MYESIVGRYTYSTHLIELMDANSYEQTRCLAKLGAFYFIQEEGNEGFFYHILIIQRIEIRIFRNDQNE